MFVCTHAYVLSVCVCVWMFEKLKYSPDFKKCEDVFEVFTPG